MAAVTPDSTPAAPAPAPANPADAIDGMGADQKRRKSFTKMQDMMGNESAAAAEVVASQMHLGEGKKGKSGKNMMEKTGTNMADGAEGGGGGGGGGCCVIS